MAKLIFDIETIGVDFDTLDQKSQTYLMDTARTSEEAEEVKNNLSFSPLTGQVIAIGILNPDTDRGAVYFDPGATQSDIVEEKDAQYIPCTEKEMLKKFWEVMGHYDQFITFNGRSFDCPYLMVRSAVHKIKPTRNLVPYRYGDEHIDLFDRLGFFGAVRRTMSLHMWCRALNIKSPKEGDIAGHEVGQAFKDGRSLEIAQYCYGDLVATKQVYEYWNTYINIK